MKGGGKMKSPILVTGAAGRVGAVGRTVTELLLKQGKAVRAMVRTEDERAQALRDKGAEVVVGNLLDLDSMHRIEIEQIANHDLRTLVAQRLRAFVFSSHHRAHRFALLQEQFGYRASYRADSTRGSGDQNGAFHFSSSFHQDGSFRPVS